MNGQNTSKLMDFVLTCGIYLLILLPVFLLVRGCNDEKQKLENTRYRQDHPEEFVEQNLEHPIDSAKYRADSIRYTHERQLFFNAIRAAGEAEDQYREEHKGDGYQGSDMLSNYEEGSEQGRQDRLEGKDYHDEEYSSSYTEGYKDGYNN